MQCLINKTFQFLTVACPSTNTHKKKHDLINVFCTLTLLINIKGEQKSDFKTIVILYLRFRSKLTSTWGKTRLVTHLT